MLPDKFEFEQLSIRCQYIGDEPWFVAKDVCEALEISQYRAFISSLAERLDEDELSYIEIETPGGRQRMRAVSESGVYEILMTSRSTKSSKFRRWLRREVVPSIRKHQVYVHVEAAEKLHGENSELTRMLREFESKIKSMTVVNAQAQSRMFHENNFLRAEIESQFTAGELLEDARRLRGWFRYDAVSDVEIASRYGVSRDEAVTALKLAHAELYGVNSNNDGIWVLRGFGETFRLRGFEPNDYRGIKSWRA